MTEPARGLRNFNPGNLERNATKWQGMAPDQSSDPRFVVFTSPQYGIRALAKVLMNYQSQNKLGTIRAIINRWAPPVENNTTAYVDAVAHDVGVDPDDAVVVDNIAVMLPLVKAIITHENGRCPYSDATLTEGIRMAGVADAKAPPLFTTKRVLAGVGSAAGSGLTFVAAIQPSVQGVHDAVAPYNESPVVAHLLPILAGAAAALAAATVVFQIVHRRATGA